MPGSFFGMPLSAVALGAARGAIEGLEELCGQSGSSLRDQGQVQYAIAKAQALHESALINLRAAIAAIWTNLLTGQPQLLAERSRARRAYVHATESALEAATLCSQAAGGAAAYEKWPFARVLRDLHTMQCHVALSRRFMELSGQASLGMPITMAIF